MDGFKRLRLVPVEVFGLMGEDHNGEETPVGWGLCDAVQSWSDCNRADGKIYRVDEEDSEPYRIPGETVEIWVRDADVVFFEKIWGEGYSFDPNVTDMVPPSAISASDAQRLRLEIEALTVEVSRLKSGGA